MPKTSNELLDNLRRVRRRFEVVSVACISKNVARQAAKDRRVDLLSPCLTFPCKRFFDYAEAALASEKLVAFEVDMVQILSSVGFPRIWLLSSLRKEVAVARKFNIPIAISSGASDENFLRSPQDYAALASLFDLPASHAFEALSDVPVSIVERNRGKLDSSYVAPGVRVVENQPLVHLIKRRYLMVQIAGSETEAISERDFMDAVWNAVLQLFGEYGASQTSLILMRYDLKKRCAVLRCSHKALDMVKASLASITQLNGEPIAFRVLGVSGTLKALGRQRLEAKF